MIGNSIHVSLLENPSHLEVVNPVILGKTRAKQDSLSRDKVLAINIHGDAAFSGQVSNLRESERYTKE